MGAACMATSVVVVVVIVVVDRHVVMNRRAVVDHRWRDLDRDLLLLLLNGDRLAWWPLVRLALVRLALVRLALVRLALGRRLVLHRRGRVHHRLGMVDGFVEVAVVWQAGAQSHAGESRDQEAGERPHWQCGLHITYPDQAPAMLLGWREVP